MNDLCSRLCGPGHSAHRLRIGFQDNVDFRRTHGLGRIGWIVTRDGLKEHALGEAHALVLSEFGRRHDLAACDTCHVGNDGLDLGDTVVAEELLNLTSHGETFSSAYTRARRPRTPRTTRAK